MKTAHAPAYTQVFLVQRHEDKQMVNFAVKVSMARLRLRCLLRDFARRKCEGLQSG